MAKVSANQISRLASGSGLGGNTTLSLRANEGMVVPCMSSDKITTANATSNNNSELGTPIINGIMTKVMGTAPRKPTQLI